MEHDDVMVVGFAARSTTRFGLMTSASAAPPPRLLAADAPLPQEPAARSDYRSGVCNIGPAEIARRRRTGVMMTIITIALLAILVGVHAPTPFRILVFFTAAVAASGFLQAWLRFCAAFGWLGVFNFNEIGTTRSVDDRDARAADRAKALRIGLACAVIGAVVTTIAFALPS